LKLTIVNIIASTRIKGEIDIEPLSQELPHAQYNPEIFSGLIYRKVGQPTVIMFASGKVSSHGAKSEREAKQVIARVVREIADRGRIIGSTELEPIGIENVAGSGDLEQEIDLGSLAKRLSSAKYEPQTFPGLIYRPYGNSVVCLIFTTGKVAIVGAKSEHQIIKTFQDVSRIASSIKCSE
jgi:transcription initiation factor TFIID TATA-box-binding protein